MTDPKVQVNLGYKYTPIRTLNMPKRRSKSNAVQSLLKQAAELSQGELKALVSGLQGLMQAEVGRDKYGKPLNQEGYIEEKFINGYGPYRYLRYWDGKTHKSVYLGKEEA